MNNIKNMNSDYMIKRSKITPTSTPNTQSTQTQARTSNVESTFTDVLNKIQKNDTVKFSKHALDRLSSRNIELSDKELSRINDAMGKAKSKGVKEALIMMDDKIFIASIQNKTIITAAMDEQLKDSVFTNIDGAVII